jgi:hypothetical protein
LPWIKQEGLLLAILLALSGLLHLRRRGAVGERARPALSLLAGTGLLAGGALLFQALALAPGVGFLAGDWRGRAVERLPQLLDLAGVFARELLAPDWLGFWLVFLAGGALAAIRRAPGGDGARLLFPVAALLAIYFAVCYAAYVDPAAQIHAAAFRIAAALVPLGLLGLACLQPTVATDPVLRRSWCKIVPGESSSGGATRPRAACGPGQSRKLAGSWYEEARRLALVGEWEPRSR